MKDEGGIIALTQDSDALLRWAVAGLELIRVTSEFGASIVGKREGSSQINHHEQTYATQRLFVKQLNSLVDIIASFTSAKTWHAVWGNTTIKVPIGLARDGLVAVPGGRDMIVTIS